MQQLIVFQQNGSGCQKIAGIKRYGKDMQIKYLFDVPAILSPVIDEPQEFIPSFFTGDLVLDFLQHPDLSQYLADLCREKEIPVIASGRRIKGAICPFTCCGLGKKDFLGPYGEQFGLPRYKVTIKNEKITAVKVVRGASCGATWEAAACLINMKTHEALSAVAREVQYRCAADPAGFDPVSGKSALHFAGDVHLAALKAAIQDVTGE